MRSRCRRSRRCCRELHHPGEGPGVVAEQVLADPGRVARHRAGTPRRLNALPAGRAGGHRRRWTCGTRELALTPPGWLFPRVAGKRRRRGALSSDKRYLPAPGRVTGRSLSWPARAVQVGPLAEEQVGALHYRFAEGRVRVDGEPQVGG